MNCAFCDAPLGGPGARPAFDPWLGRLWRVCPSCTRWNVVPLESRWEALELLEREVRDRGRSLLRTEHLDLVRVEAGEVIRVGRAPRPELAAWRYGDLLPAPRPGTVWAWLRRLLIGLPSSPHGYDTSEIGTLAYPHTSGAWFASPFIDDAPGLTALFGHLPLAPECPACGRPLGVAPSSFERVRLTSSAGEAALAAPCVGCGREVVVPLDDARPALRLGLFVVNRRLREVPLVERAASGIDRAGGARALLAALARRDAALGETAPEARLALHLALDELAEAELLEAEWREAEEIAALVDGALTPLRRPPDQLG